MLRHLCLTLGALSCNTLMLPAALSTLSLCTTNTLAAEEAPETPKKKKKKAVNKAATNPLAKHSIVPIERQPIQAQIWDPKVDPATQESVRVRVVDFGMINCRGFEDVHLGDRYARGRDLVGGSHNDYSQDLDNNPKTQDWVQYMPFSMTNPLSPEVPLWDYDYISSKFYGGFTFNHVNRTKRGITEQLVNANETHNHMQPANNWALHNLNKIKGSPFTAYGSWIWKKEDYKHGAADTNATVSFDETSRLAHSQQRYFSGWEGVKFIVQDGEQFYLSESLTNAIKDDGSSACGIFLIREACPLDLKWIPWNPIEGTNHIHFDNTLPYEAHTFTDIQSIGWYTYKDSMNESTVASKWESFECYATVTRPQMTSELMDMKKINDFYITTTEVPYQVWKDIYRWSSGGGQWTLWPGPSQYDKDGDMGSMDFGDESHQHEEPVTDITIYDALVWCNNLSQYEGKDPVYYTDASFETPYKIVRESQWFTDPALFERPSIYVKWQADGYRLPTAAEWAQAAGTGGDAVNSGNKTAVVGSGGANSNGLYDMQGNVWELVWTFGDVMIPNPETLTAVGGGFADENMSSSAYGSVPYNGHPNIGFRFVRRDYGSPAPTIDADIPRTWTIAKDHKQQTGIPAESLITFADIPKGTTTAKVCGKKQKCTITAFEMATHEVNYREWKKVYDWALNNGYSFDFDGDMGSMDYKMFTNIHSPDEPVTGINYYDTLAWCNALSEIKGRTPVFYTNPEKTELFKVSQRWESALYRGADSSPSYKHEKFLWESDGAGGKKPVFSRFINNKQIQGWSEHFRLYMKWDADGYRLPTMTEFSYAMTAGSKKRHPWGDDYNEIEQHAWYYLNSGNKSQAIGTKPANAFGLYDMVGNVAEFHIDSDRKGGGKPKSDTTTNPLMNMSCEDFSSRWRATFLRTGFNYDYTDGTRSEPMAHLHHEYGGATPGWHWPDIGFRPVSNPHYHPDGFDPDHKPTHASKFNINRNPGDE